MTCLHSFFFFSSLTGLIIFEEFHGCGGWDEQDACALRWRFLDPGSGGL